MRKSDITVSMPMSSFNELEEYKNKYIELISSLQKTIDTSMVDNKLDLKLNFDIKKALDIIKKFLPDKYKGIPFQLLE